MSGPQETSSDAPGPSQPAPAKEEKKSFIGGTPFGKTYAPVQVPTPEQMAQEDFLNNCAVRTIMSTVLGGGMGVAFGLFMGGLRDSMDPVSCIRGRVFANACQLHSGAWLQRKSRHHQEAPSRDD